MLDNHPLRTVFVYHARLEGVRRQASVDGHGFDPWHLAAVVEGLLLMDSALRIVDRGQIFEAARSALTLHQWIAGPDFESDRSNQGASPPALARSQAYFLRLDREFVALGKFKDTVP